MGMIVIQGTITTKPDKRDATIEACNKMRAATIDEPGCLCLLYTSDAADEL